MSHRSINELSGLELGEFKLEERVVAVGLGAIYQAHDRITGRPVLLVLVQADSQAVPDLDERFRRRVTTVSQLNHAGIASIINIEGTASGVAFAAFDHPFDLTLADRLSQMRARGEQFSTIEALELVRRIAGILAVAHPAGIIHYHLTPEHIFLSEDDIPHLIDLSVPVAAHTRDASGDLTHAPRLGYLSTEQLEGKALSGQSNIYSLGIILYELIAGQCPEIPASSWDIFDQRRADLPRGVPLEEICPELSAATHRVVRDCLWREEWNRFETADMLKLALDKAIAAEKAAVGPRRSRFEGQGRRIAVASLVVILLLVVFVLLKDRIGGPDQSSSLPMAPPALVQTTESHATIYRAPVVGYAPVLDSPQPAELAALAGTAGEQISPDSALF